MDHTSEGAAAAAREGGGRVDTEDIRKLVACFYVDNGLIAARDADTLQTFLMS